MSIKKKNKDMHNSPLILKPDSMKQFDFPPGVRMLGEDDYADHMAGANKEWRNKYVQSGDFAAADGLKLRYYHAVRPSGEHPKGCVVILHGYCGFWGKFHEMSEYYWQGGYEVFFLEQRGHGYSGREIDVVDMVHVRDFADYVSDLLIFMDEIVNLVTADLKHIMYAHSMGGAVGALFLEQHPGYFDAAVLSTPMFAIDTGTTPKLLLYLLRAKSRLLHQVEEPFPGGKPWTGRNVFNTSSTMSQARYLYIFNQRLADTHYQTNRLSNGWGAASLRAMSQLHRQASNINIPILMFNAGNDSLLSPAGHYSFAKKVSHIEFYIYEDSKHEIFNAADNIRCDYYSRIFKFIDDNGKVHTEGCSNQ